MQIYAQDVCETCIELTFLTLLTQLVGAQTVELVERHLVGRNRFLLGLLVTFLL